MKFNEWAAKHYFFTHACLKQNCSFHSAGVHCKHCEFNCKSEKTILRHLGKCHKSLIEPEFLYMVKLPAGFTV